MENVDSEDSDTSDEDSDSSESDSSEEEETDPNMYRMEHLLQRMSSAYAKHA
jgi:hypothetical protein